MGETTGVGRGDIEAMRRALVRTWYPFFARFPQPTGVQAAAWRPLLSGRDAVVCSATASGKTEAILAPLVERHLTPGTTGPPRVLVVGPTRALVNDLSRRVHGPLERMGLRAHRRTGDHATLDRERPPHVLITTPESLDSLLVRQTSFLKEVRALVLDELHVLDGGPRGDQLRILVERLRAVVGRKGRRLQTVASSATIEAPDALAARYLEDAALVVVPGSRALEADIVATPSRDDILAAVEAAHGEGGARKILVFVDRRADVEAFAAEARRRGRLGERVYAHHGSLSRNERERVEARFLGDPSAVCFATMTLELGIDIGDVDRTVLVGPPNAVSSFLQRIGRGNRRTGACRVTGCCRDAADLARFRHLVDVAAEGRLLAPPYRFRPSALAQQALSLLTQSPSGWLTPAVLRSRLPATLREEWSERVLGEIFEQLADEEWLRAERQGRYVAGPRLNQAFERRSLHANLQPEAASLEVVDETTGRSLGKVAMAQDGSRLALAGRTRHVVRTSEGKAYVRDSGRDPELVKFPQRPRATLSFPLARSLAAHLGLGTGPLPLVTMANGTALFHFAGSLGGELLAAHLKGSHGWPVRGAGAFALLLAAPPDQERPPVLLAEALRRDLGPVRQKLTRLAAPGRFHAQLPPAVQRGFVASVVPIDELVALWKDARFQSYDGHELTETLHALAQVR